MSESEHSSDSLERGEQEVVPVPAVIQEQPPVPEQIVPNLLNPVPVIPVRMVEEHNVTKIKIPIFNPEAPTVQARAFLALVKMARKSAGNKEDGTPKWTKRSHVQMPSCHSKARLPDGLKTLSRLIQMN